MNRRIRIVNTTGLRPHTEITDADTGQRIDTITNIKLDFGYGDGVIHADITYALPIIDIIAHTDTQPPPTSVLHRHTATPRVTITAPASLTAKLDNEDATLNITVNQDGVPVQATFSRSDGQPPLMPRDPKPVDVDQARARAYDTPENEIKKQ